MVSAEYDSFSIDYEEVTVSSDQFIRGNMIRSRIRIFVNSVCLTDPDGRYTVSDFLPHNCTKLLRGVEKLTENRPHRVPFTDTFCDLQFEPVTEEAVRVTAYGADGTPRNPNIPREGIEVKKESVIDEIIRASRCVRSSFDEIEEIRSDDNYQKFIELLSEAEDI